MRGSKQIAAVVSAAALASTLVACSSGGESDAGTSGSTGGGPTEISMVIFGGGGADTFNNAAAEFNSRQSEVKLSIQPAPGDYNQFLGARTTSGDLPDMFWLTPYSQVQQFAATGKLLDLSDQPFVDKVYPAALDSVTQDGKVYAYPLRQEYLGIFYNKDLFAQAGIDGVPTTFTDFKADVEKLEAAGIQPFAPIYKDDWTLNHAFSVLEAAAVGSDNIPSWIASMQDGSGTFSTSNDSYVFDFMDLMKQHSGPNFLDSDSTAGFSAFANGQAAMLFSGEFSLLNVSDINADLPVGLFAAPVTDNPADAKLDVDVGVTVAINADTPNKEAALKVLDFMSDDSDQNGWFNATNNAMGEAGPAMPWTGSYTNPYLDDYHKYVDAGNVYPWVYQQLPAGINTEIGKIVQGYFAGTVSRDQLMPQLDQADKDLVQ